MKFPGPARIHRFEPCYLPDVDLSFTAEEEAFRDEVRAWVDANLPVDWRQGEADGRDDFGDVQREWQRRLHRGGWLTLAWPKEMGGRGATPVMQAIYEEEMARVSAPSILGRLGVSLLAPLLSVYGSDWQKETYVEKIISSQLVFCQGFSEPDAGSDLSGQRLSLRALGRSPDRPRKAAGRELRRDGPPARGTGQDRGARLSREPAPRAHPSAAGQGPRARSQPDQAVLVGDGQAHPGDGG